MSATTSTAPPAVGTRRPGVEHVRVAVVGAGFAGLATAVALRRRGITDFVLLERGDDVGGTWRDNTYPGCACDVPSHLYSLSFAPNPGWSRSFSGQPEIQAYVRRVFDEHDIRRHVRLRHELLQARWEEDHWHLRTGGGELTADVLVLGSGGLSDPQFPDLPGLADFRGELFHSSQWRHDLDLAGRRVAVVGTGASAIQFVPRIAPEVSRLHLFQRTPPWVIPRMDRRLPAVERALYRRVPGAEKLARAGVFALRESAVPALTRHPRMTAGFAAIGRLHLRRKVRDPELRRKLTPDFAAFCKRILLSNDYYPALTRPNVEVVDSAVARFTPDGVVSADGRARQVDTVIVATGFAIGDLPIAHRIHGRDGRPLSDRWAEQGMSALRGTTVAGYPNLFVLVGPNSGVGHTSIVYMIESQVPYVMDALRLMEERGLAAVEPLPEAQERWNAEVQGRMGRTVWQQGGCRSWYQDAQGRNPVLWPGSVISYRRSLRRVDPSEYRLVPARRPAVVLP